MRVLPNIEPNQDLNNTTNNTDTVNTNLAPTEKVSVFD